LGRAGDAVVVLHDDSTLGIADGTLIAFDIQVNTGGVLFFDNGAITGVAIIGDGDKGFA